MISIGYVVHGMQPGGIERSITRIINGLDKSHFRPVIICIDRSGPAVDWLHEKHPVIEVKKRSGNDLASVFRLARYLRQYRIDVLQSHNWGTLVEATLARRLSRTAFHVHAERGTVMGMVDKGGFRYRLRSMAMSASLRSVDQLISNAHAVAQRVHDRCGYPLNEIQIIPNGVPEPESFDHVAIRGKMISKLGIPNESILVGSVGRLVSVKGFDLAIEAMEKLLHAMPHAHLVLIGDGPEKDRLSSMAHKCGIEDHVHLVGASSNVNEWLGALDIYLNSSRSEGMSQSLIEAMAFGLPVVATNVGDNSRLIRRPGMECGLLCEPESADSIVEQLTLLASQQSVQSKFAAAAVDCHSQFYSERTLIETMETLYGRLVGDSFLGKSGARQSVPTLSLLALSVLAETALTVIS
ncbi:MAG: glycosyltransferase [Planctomycetales bacterium]|nr:glycosyltransferase [Planctomycetales bacterium]